MPGGLPLGIEVCNGFDVGTAGAVPSGTFATSSGTANTKGAWFQLIAVTPEDCVFAVIEVYNFTSGNNQMFDIGIGPAGSEQTIISNEPVQGTTEPTSYVIPLHIPAGSRVALRTQSPTISTNVRVRMSLFDGAFTMMEGIAGIDSPMGVNTATSLTPVVPPSASAATKGAYTQLIASTLRDYAGLLVSVTAGTNGDQFITDIAIGAAGSEQIIIPNLGSFVVTGAVTHTTYVPVPVPAGSRIAARCACSAGAATGPFVGVQGAYQ